MAEEEEKEKKEKEEEEEDVLSGSLGNGGQALELPSSPLPVTQRLRKGSAPSISSWN